MRATLCGGRRWPSRPLYFDVEASVPNDQDKAAGTRRRHRWQPPLPPLAFILLFGNNGFVSSSAAAGIDADENTTDDCVYNDAANGAAKHKRDQWWNSLAYRLH